ncbi:MAG: metal-sulfur cluster assembly factor [Candidatus Zixiibacteriota bacterium]
MALPTKEEIIEVLKPIHDPEIRIGIVDLGLIYDVLIEETGKAIVKMTLTTPACPYGEMLIAMVHRAVEEFDSITEVEVQLVWDPVWDPKEMCSDGAKDILGIW